MDADRLEFRFRSASDKVDVACSQVTVPSTWLVLSRVWAYAHPECSMVP